MIAYPISTAKFYKTFKAVIGFFAVKYNMEQLNNLWIKCYSNEDTLSRVMPTKNACIQKYVKRNLKDSPCRKSCCCFFFDLVYI